MCKCRVGYKISTELEFYNIFGDLTRFCVSVNYFFCKLLISCSWHARNIVANPPVCFFVSKWVIPLMYPLYNLFSLYYYMIPNRKKEVDISDVSSRNLHRYTRISSQNSDGQKSSFTFLYIDVFYNTLVFLLFNTYQKLFWLKKVNFVLLKQCRKRL